MEGGLKIFLSTCISISVVRDLPPVLKVSEADNASGLYCSISFALRDIYFLLHLFQLHTAYSFTNKREFQ